MILTAEQIIKIHDNEIKKYGGEYGIREEGTFNMLVNAPYQSAFGIDCYPSVFDKAAKYLEGFARHQVFYDGNKRTALVSCGTFLAINNYHLRLEPMQFYQLTLDIANNKNIETGEISAFLEKHSIPLEKDFENTKENDILIE